MHENSAPLFELSTKQKQMLRGMAHHREPIVYAGKEGLSAPLLKSLEAALKAHELIKIKIGQNCPLDRNAAAQELTLTTGATLVQVIGRMIVLYRPNPDLPAAKQIVLP